MKKRGKLSKGEEKFILDNLGKLTPAEIAHEINRNPPPVLKFIAKQNLIHKGMSDDEEVLAALRQKLSLRPYYPEICKQLTDSELEYFTKLWIEIMHQFREDVLPSEEMQIKQYLILEVLMNRSMRERQKHMQELEKVETELNKEYDVPEGSRDMGRITSLETQVTFLRSSVGSYTAEHTKLSSDSQKISKDMKATREQRIKVVDSAKESWTGLLRSLEDEEVRDRVGHDIAVMTLAKDKAAETLGEFHTFSDGMVDRPFLTPEIVQAAQENDNEV